MHGSRYGIAFVLVLFINTVLCSELMVDDEYVVMDGIKVRKDSIRNETNNLDNSRKKEGQRDKDSGLDESEDDQNDDGDDDEDDDDDDNEEMDNNEDEDFESTKHLPRKCHGKLKSLREKRDLLFN